MRTTGFSSKRTGNETRVPDESGETRAHVYMMCVSTASELSREIDMLLQEVQIESKEGKYIIQEQSTHNRRGSSLYAYGVTGPRDSRLLGPKSAFRNQRLEISV